MPHKVDKRALTPYMKELGAAACKDMRPMTLITPFHMKLGHKDYFPARTTFLYDGKADGIYLIPTADYNRLAEEALNA